LARDCYVIVVDDVGIRRVVLSRDRFVSFADRRRFVCVFVARFLSRGIVAYGRRAEERREELPEHRRRRDVHALRPWIPIRRGRIRAVIVCVRRLRRFRSRLAEFAIGL
jgi:hypothetical protein